MITRLKQLKCGQCGQELHRLYLYPSGEVVAECIDCESQSIIEVTEPKIQIANLAGLGTLCVFDR